MVFCRIGVGLFRRFPQVLFLFCYMHDKIARKVVPLEVYTCSTRMDRVKPSSDDLHNGCVIAVVFHTGEDRETEAVRVETHDPDLLALADHVGLLLRFDRNNPLFSFDFTLYSAAAFCSASFCAERIFAGA